MAAGMGSRYGGLKQLDQLGPAGETIMDYSLFDAVRAGFGKAVFVIRRSFAPRFTEQVLSKYKNLIETEVVFQEPNELPAPFTAPQGREKPWGTNHAVLVAEPAVHTPFAVINADDFYGTDAFHAMAQYLQAIPATEEGHYCMVAYRLQNTMSRGGSVSRGVCSIDKARNLEQITEHKEIYFGPQDQILSKNAQGEVQELDPQTPVSMNMWGFTPDFFRHSGELFRQFLAEHGDELKSESYIPSVVDTLIRRQQASVTVLNSTARWFGVTYAQDRDAVQQNLRTLTQEGVYPSPLLSDQSTLI